MFRTLCIIATLLAFWAANSIQDDGECGLPAPDPTKTCISLRLPWKPKPMYFCVEKAKFKYRNQCQNKFSSNCGSTIRNDSLLLAAPWECCPKVSNPDSCAQHKCPPPPYERKCQTIPADVNKPHDCCPKYFCEENLVPEMCHFKLLESGCNVPPEGKTNCVGFHDQHGCCPKFQCDGDTRPGYCPAEAEAIKYMIRYNTTKAKPQGRSMSDHAIAEESLVPHKARGGAGGAKYAMASDAMQVHTIYRPPPQTHVHQISCVGDFNCPGTMKCCSSDMYVYVTEGHYLQRNKNPTNGYCSEAAPKNATETN